MHIIVGLGNPGKKYEKTRHNVGFQVIDLLGKRNNIDVKRLKHKALCGEGNIGGKKVILVKPQTFMNLSGETLVDIIRFYKLNPEKITVIYDDIDLEVGTIRIRKKGSPGSHNGMKSIINLIQTGEFPRIRIGIGRPEFEDLSSFVLGKFTNKEEKKIGQAIENAALGAETIVAEGVDKAMNKYNG